MIDLNECQAVLKCNEKASSSRVETKSQRVIRTDVPSFAPIAEVARGIHIFIKFKTLDSGGKIGSKAAKGNGINRRSMSK
ncbi:Hypothetical predicted protein [Octopus vulgaris]|uniref:Uncharacterized protein n=1 Tax=Octopus vulgaris TaxID=6645 RepID=A0AA36BN39_OCTVU|nr:Hypothetical predicted protein [Octopus vulgaris]